MRVVASLLSLAACLPQLVSAHGFVSGVRVNGKWTATSDPVWFYYPAGQGPVTAGWDSLNQDLGFVEPARYGSNDIACHKSATAGKNFIDVNAGQTIELYWNTWPESHKGPIIDYLAPYNGETTAGSLSWSKFSQRALSSGQRWVTDDLISNNFTTTTTIPRNLAPGSYVLRHEIIALHEGNRQNAAQMYPQCINLEITGSGTAQPAGVVATELYDAADPGIFFNPYTNDLVYPIPGPVNSFASGGDGGSAPAPAPSTAPEEPEEQPSQPPANDDDTETAPAPAPTTLATSTRVATPTQPPSIDGGCGAAPQANALYQQCGGINFSGSTTCAEGTCVEQNPYYSQCVPASN